MQPACCSFIRDMEPTIPTDITKDTLATAADTFTAVIDRGSPNRLVLCSSLNIAQVVGCSC